MKENQVAPAEDGADIYLEKLLVVLRNLRDGELRLRDLPVDSPVQSRIYEVLRELARKRFGEEAKANFLANISHEIRTPLNSILGFSDILIDPEVSMEDKSKGAEIVRRNGLELIETVDEILDITKAETGQLKTYKVETQLHDLLLDLQVKWQPEAVKKNIALQFELDSRLPKRVITDPERLRQILGNVLGNAVKFTSEGSVRVSARLEDHGAEPPMLQFEITDTGVGIDENWSERIFMPFSQADASRTRLYGGTGVGLALARSLARALGGDVKLLHSARDSGSCFLIQLQVELPASEEWARGESAPRLQDHPLRGRKILLVEDLEDNQFLITQFLHRAGAEVEIANNGEEGVEKALAGRFDVVLMDIQMPKLDGYQATARLRAAGYERPIIALTAHALLEEREKCLRIGCDGHLTKPINRQRLIETLVAAAEV